MKRRLVVMLVLALALGGCGGSDGGADAGGSAATPSASPAASGKGSTAVPTPPVGSAVTRQFNDCMEGQGVKLPSPNPSVSLGKKDLEKMKAALRTCMLKMQPTPDVTPK